MAGPLNKKKIITWSLVMILLFLCVWFGLIERASLSKRFREITNLSKFAASEHSGNQDGTPMDQHGNTEETSTPPSMVTKKIMVPPVFQYSAQRDALGNVPQDIQDPGAPLEQGKRITLERKKKAGIDKSLDLIVRSDERFIIGGHTISMQEILDKALHKKGAVVEKSIHASGAVTPDNVGSYGIYVVRPGDNIWNIHFHILREYFAGCGARLIGTEDEPTDSGKSSGIGKLLKFSENMVIIYDLVHQGITEDIHLLEPLSKIVVYNMHEIFSLLREIDYDNVENIRFDGNAIWIPANQP